MRRCVAFMLLLTCLFWQAPVLAGDNVLTSAPENAEHVLLHWQDAHHHHHDDGSFHENNSQESIEHVALDGVSNVSAALTPPVCMPAPSLSHALSTAADAVVCSGCRDSLRRPPRHLS